MKRKLFLLCICTGVYVLQVKFDLRLILILPRLIFNFLCPLALVDRGNQESTLG